MNTKALQLELEQNGQSYTQILEEHDHIIASTVAWVRWHFDKATREDVAQRIRYQLIRSDIKEKSPEKIPSCIRRLAISRCIDEVRKLVRRNQTFIQVESELDIYPGSSTTSKATLDPIREIMEDEERVALNAAVASLKEPCASTITSFYLDGLSYKEIAAAQKVHIGTVGGRLNRCMEKLKTLVKDNPHLKEDLQQCMRTYG